MSTIGWFTAPSGSQTTQSPEQIEQERQNALAYTGTDGKDIHWQFIRLAMGSVASMAIFPMQDVLGLGTDSRMNLPGTVRGNWEWRFEDKSLTPAIEDRLAFLSSLYERNTHLAGEKPAHRAVSGVRDHDAEADRRKWIPHPFG